MTRIYFEEELELLIMDTSDEEIKKRLQEELDKDHADLSIVAACIAPQN